MSYLHYPVPRLISAQRRDMIQFARHRDTGIGIDSTASKGDLFQITSTLPPIHLSVHYPATYPSIIHPVNHHSSIHPSSCPCIHFSFIHPFITQTLSICPSIINLPIHLSTIHLPIGPPINPLSIHCMGCLLFPSCTMTLMSRYFIVRQLDGSLVTDPALSATI